MREAPVNIGDILAGKYAVEKVLGSGAMGVVVAARQLELDRRVALKFMTGAAAQLGQEHRERFIREARAAGKLQGQHVARVFDVGQLAEGEPYIVMEYLDGKDLAAVLNERGPLPVEEAVLYVLQTSEALAEAHAAGIVHRDVKPANMFLTRGVDGAPCVKLVDFGVAKVSGGQNHLTGAVQMLGSPSYMAPESLEGAPNADARTDVWALGVTLYELLAGSGVVPFQAPELQALAARIWFRPPTPLQTYRPDVPSGLAEVILQALEKPLDRRFQSVAAFAAALAPYGPARQASYAERVARTQGADIAPARPTDFLPADPTLSPVRSVGEEPSTVAPQGAHRMLLLAACVLIVGLAVALFLGLGDRASDPGPVASVSAAPAVPGPAPSHQPAAPVTAPLTAAAPPLVSPSSPSSAPVPGVHATSRPKATARPASVLPQPPPAKGGDIPEGPRQ